MKTYQLPQSLSLWIDKHLKTLGFNLNQSQLLAKSVLQASNDYQEISSTTPWSDPNTMAAYLCYFFPLNYIRTLKVIDEGKRWGFFSDINHAVDYGCGPGTSTKALLADPELQWQAIHGVDVFANLAKFYLDTPRRETHLSFGQDMPKVHAKGSLLVGSYVLNELSEIPTWIDRFDKIMILEPSTKQAFPGLLQLRNQLLENKYHLIAPCPHSHQCPLQESKRDWCHDRVHWEQPEWFQRLEKHLPIKNRTLSFSYLLASRKPIVQPSYGRIVGDAQVEKGKTRWMICQGPDREFLSHLKRQGQPPEIYRGERIQLEIYEKRGDELRFDTEKLKKI